MVAVWELHNLHRGKLSLEEFIAKLGILIKEANYPVDHRFLSDILVLGMNSDRVRKECFKEGTHSLLTKLDKWQKPRSQQTNKSS